MLPRFRRTIPTATVVRRGRSATVKVHGDITISTAGTFLAQLRAVCRRREIKAIVIDFADAGRLDSSGIAVVSLISQQARHAGKQLDLERLGDQHRAMLELALAEPEAAEHEEVPTALERVGDQVVAIAHAARDLGVLIYETIRQLGKIVRRTKRLPAGSFAQQLLLMGSDGVLIVALITFLLGTTMAFQGVIQLQRFGAGVYVADMVGMSIVRELAPLMTAVIITGRTGAAIAAELGTMQVRSEVDALSAMGINPVRFLILPRMLSITVIGPALTLIGMFVGMVGGMLVASLMIDMPAITFWQRMVERLSLGDFEHGLIKSLVFAWIIGFAGCHLGMRAGGDASSVGTATTRTVVTSIFGIIIVDALFATVSTLLRHS